MSPDETTDVAQLDELARSLGDACRRARTASAELERPAPDFAASLRAALMSTPSQAAAPVRPMVEPERRRTDRPFDPTPVDLPADRRVIPLEPKVRLRTPPARTRTGWVGIGLAACLAVGVALYGGSLLLRPAGVSATAQEASSATLIRAGVRTTLTSYETLRVDDEVEVGVGGHAALTIGDSRVRLSSGADVKLERIDPGQIVLDQLAGEVYHRVSLPRGGDYSVKTGAVTFEAQGTAFDLTRRPDASGGDQLYALALVDGIDIDGVQGGTTLHLGQGMSATLGLSAAGGSTGSLVSGPIPDSALSQAWIVQNARLDAQLGFPMGVLDGLRSPSPTVNATPTSTPTSSPAAELTPTAESTPTATPTASPSPSPTPKPTARPTPKATPKPTPKATPTAPASPVNLGELQVADNGDGTYTFTWTKYAGAWESNFFYKLAYLEGTTGEPSYAAGDNYCAATTDQGQNSFVVSVADAPGPGTYRMRLQALDLNGPAVVLGQTATITVIVAPAV